MSLCESVFIETTPVSEHISRRAITEAYRMDETECLQRLIELAEMPLPLKSKIAQRARHLVEQLRNQEVKKGRIEGLMQEYDLSSDEGIALMCLAESLLRIPDTETVDRLIKDKLSYVDWQSHLDKNNSLFVNAATWGLMLTGKIYSGEENKISRWQSALNRLIKFGGEGAIRQSLKAAMKMMGRQFVMGETIQEALERAQKRETQGYVFSYDMLGEAAKTAQDAEHYFTAYLAAIAAIKKSGRVGLVKGGGISVKLSALHPRYEHAQKKRLIKELVPRVKQLVYEAKAANIGLTIDAEESERLDISLDIIEMVLLDDALRDWDGFGLAVQAYQKRALPVLHWLKEITAKLGRKIRVRLVKGAYWDSEIKRSQENGLEGFPVFTRKQATDVSYIACAKFLLENSDQFYAQFATHNAYTLATILELANGRQDFEFQRLHGMGEALYDELVKDQKILCRVYAPVGGHQHLLAYLVRRLLENGANTSFVNRIHDKSAPLDELIACPVTKLSSKAMKPHPGIALPLDLFKGERINSAGLDWTNRALLARLQQDLKAPHWTAIREWNGDTIQTCVKKARDVQPAWDQMGFVARSQIIDKFADLLENHRAPLLSLLVREAGKTLPNAIAEIREAVDFCRYYAHQARSEMGQPKRLPGPTGESNELYYHGRGVIVCISPWNFPLAIFIGQVVAALVTGNTVVAKPAEQTPHIADYAVQLLHDAGVPDAVVTCVHGLGETVGAQLVADPAIAGVMFTGSTEVAKLIQKSLAEKPGPIVPLIAETGGMNCMLVDSSALLEQVVTDVITSAFDSAGQRCSALRVIFVQESIADNFIQMLIGAMKELVLGDPALLVTDVGPVIDKAAKALLEEHIAYIEGLKGQTVHTSQTKMLFQSPMPAKLEVGVGQEEAQFFPPTLVEIQQLNQLKREVFGPVLHLIRYKPENLAEVIQAINQTGYGLTFGLHSRIEEQISDIEQYIQAGNLYVNRNMVGAVVGVQPFGGQGLSGTGPKAGGPHYLHRLVIERTLTVNTTAFGGNASLLSLDDDM